MLNNTELYFPVTTSTGGAVNYYVSAPYKCTIRDMIVTAQADPGDADTVTVLDGTTSVSRLAAGAAGTGRPARGGATLPLPARGLLRGRC